MYKYIPWNPTIHLESNTEQVRMISGVKKIKAKKFEMTFYPQEERQAPQPEPPQPQPDPLLEPVQAGEMLDHMERILNRHREEAMQQVERSMAQFGRRLDRCEASLIQRDQAGPSGANKEL